MSSKTEAFVDVTGSQKKVLRIEAAMIGALMVVTVLLTHALIRNYINLSRPAAISIVPGLIMNESFQDIKKSSSQIGSGRQATTMFRPGNWVVSEQLFVQNFLSDGWIEWTLKDVPLGKKQARIYLTKATDYGIVQVSVNGKPVGVPVDLYDREVRAADPIELGVVEITGPVTTIRVATVGRNANNQAPHYQFGIQGILFTAVQ